MKLLSYTKDASELEFITESFPFCFLKGFSELIVKHKKNNYYFLYDDGLIVPVEIIKTRIITLLQFHFRPLTTKAEDASVNEEKEFLNKCVRFISDKKLAHRILQPANYALFNSTPQNCKRAPFGTYTILLNKSEDEIVANMQSRYRSAIRQFQALNPEIREGAGELKTFSDLHKTTMLRTTHFFEDETDMAAFIKYLPNNTLVRNVYHNDELQGGLFILYSKYGAYYMHGASADTTHASGAIKYLHYQSMAYLKAKGVMQYDFVGARLSDVGGTKLEGIQNFKKRFGSELQKGYLWKTDINVVRCKSFDTVLKSRNLVKGLKNPHDIIDQEFKKFKV